MLKAWFYGLFGWNPCPYGLFGLFLTALNAVLWLGCDRFRGPIYEVSMACSKHGLRVVWLKSLPLGTVWTVLKGH